MGRVWYEFWTLNPDQELDVEALEAHLKGPMYHLKLYYQRVEKPPYGREKDAKKTGSPGRVGKKKT